MNPKQLDKTAFPELTPEENSEIRAARDNGSADFWPCIPSADAQAKNTLTGARKFNSQPK